MAQLTGSRRSDTALIPAGASFSGLVTFRGRARIDGQLSGGAVVASGALHVGPGAEVRAHIEVDELVIEGSVDGEVVAHRRLAVLGSGRFRGTLRTPGLALADGCAVDARCDAGQPAVETGSSTPHSQATARWPEPGSRRAAGKARDGLPAQPSSPRSA